jgi:hypothetical protein
MQKRKSTSMALVPVTTVSTVNVAAAKPPGKNRRKNQRKREKKKLKNRSSNGRMMQGGDCSDAYAAVLTDPFDCPPIRLGLGALIPTRLCSAYIRTSFITGADGSFQAWLSPTQVCLTATSANGGFFMADTQLAGSGPTFNGPANATDKASILADFDQLRVIAAGLRCWVMQARTAAPGILFAGQANPNITDSIPNSTGNGVSVTALSNLPQTQIEYGLDAIQSCWRPEELSRFNFYALDDPSNTTVGTTNPALGPAVFIAGTGFPVGCTVWFEGVAHYEGYATSVSSSQGNIVQQLSTADSGFASIESLWNTTKHKLGDAVAAAGALIYENMTAENLVKGAKGLNAIRNIRKENGGFRPLSNALLYRGMDSDWKD